MPIPIPKVRRSLSADALHRTLHDSFEQIPDHRPQPDISLRDALLSGFALFSLKDPSLLAFDARRPEGNLHRLYGIGQVPSDTRMREILDPVDPARLRPVFHDVFRALQRGKALEPLVFHAGCSLLALDGTGYFSSPTVHCPSCLEKVHRETGTVTYAHQLLGAVLVHPDFRAVIPWAPEPIIKQDGTTKNDCERNAAKRLLRKIRQEHPHLGFIVIEDGRARWKIENETFNTLKNQGYQFEHNFGHGQQNLSVVFALLMMLAFLVDQTQQLCCPLFQAVWHKFGSKRALWDNLRSHCRHVAFASMRHLYAVMLGGLAKELPAPQPDTS